MTESYIERESRCVAYNYKPLPVVLTKGQGIHLWDDKGKRYIDMMSAYSAVSHGHGNGRLIKALQQQAEKLCITSRAFHTNQLAPFMEKLLEISHMDMGLPMNTGAEAVETAIKAARLWGYKVKNIAPDKAEIIVAENNFHGRTTTIISASSEDSYKENFGPLTPGFKVIPFGDPDALQDAITPNTCAFIVEPMQGEAGIIIPPKGWLKKVQAICKENQVLLILDEVQTGLGRTGAMFAYMHEIDRPDGLIVGKALGGGILPISAFLGKKEILELFQPGSHGSTFGGNPLASAVALEALNILTEDNMAEHSAKMGELFKKSVEQFNSPIITEIRGSGLWIGVEIDPQKACAHNICLTLMERGLLTKETHDTTIRFAPPLTITQEELTNAIDIIRNVFKEYENGA
jgi:ornithine--oxo-acid transaminase